jgi:nucleoside-diphosphate-sugar epimerase
MTDALTASSGSLNVFVNGGSTPLGRALVRLLVAAGHRVAASALGSAEAGLLRADGALPTYPGLTRAGELRSAFAAAKATVIINLAPTYPYGAPQTATEWDAYTPVIGDGTNAALEAAKAVGAEYFIQASFSFLGGDDHDHGDHEPPSAPVIRVARKAEAAVLASGLSATILRFGIVYSAESAALRGLRDALLRGRPLLAGADHTRANWIHAEDGARATMLAVAARPVGETLYVVDDKPIPYAGFLNAFAEQFNLVPPGQMPDLMQPLFAGATQRAMMAQPSGASNAATKERLGWTLRYPTLAVGIEQSLMMWRAEEAVQA